MYAEAERRPALKNMVNAIGKERRCERFEDLPEAPEEGNTLLTGERDEIECENHLP